MFCSGTGYLDIRNMVNGLCLLLAVYLATVHGEVVNLQRIESKSECLIRK